MLYVHFLMALCSSMAIAIAINSMIFVLKKSDDVNGRLFIAALLWLVRQSQVKLE